MSRAYYSASVKEFLEEGHDSILGKMVVHHEFALEDLQRNAWVTQMLILKDQLEDFLNAHILFEYSIPRMGKRVDVVLLVQGIIFVIEFKVGDTKYTKSAMDQVLDYALDLKYFHEQSHNRQIVPIVIATEAKQALCSEGWYEDGVHIPVPANKNNLSATIGQLSSSFQEEVLDSKIWENSRYKPTPTIIEAAQALYKGHNVQDISRSDAGTINLAQTSHAISRIIDDAKANRRKAICFVTGVPGSGKTLAGLNIANLRQDAAEGEHAVFLSGNGPLVKVLQEALARSAVFDGKLSGHKTTKADALRRSKTFIQNIHVFRDEMLQSSGPPFDRIAVFDEAQRAWDTTQASSFMKQRKGITDFHISEPDFLVGVLDRHKDWAVIVCLVGEGQEINTGEAGIGEWLRVLGKKYPYWSVYAPSRFCEDSLRGVGVVPGTASVRSVVANDDLNLAVSIRSFRSEHVSVFVECLLDLNLKWARNEFLQVRENYPIAVTRSLAAAKCWLRKRARGSERIGLVASSGAYRLKPLGINVKNKIDPANWFLNGSRDVRSSTFLEDVATEFDIQGLELDWVGVIWGSNLRLSDKGWEHWDFKGTKWQRIQKEQRQKYMLNAYRVLLTRARQGMVILVPEGNLEDDTRLPSFYDRVFDYFCEIGLETIQCDS